MSSHDLSVDLQSLAPAFIEALSVPLLVCDREMRIVFSNPVAETQLNALAGMLLFEPLPKLAEAVGNFRRSATVHPPLTILRGTSAPYLALLSSVKSSSGPLTLCLLPGSCDSRGGSPHAQFRGLDP